MSIFFIDFSVNGCMEKGFLLFLAALLLTGCITGKKSANTAGKIVESGNFGTTEVQGVGNADEEAKLDRQEKSLIITHKKGDILSFTSKKPSLIKEAIKSMGRESPENVLEMDLFEELEVIYKPQEGAQTSIASISTKASTGTSGEDTAAITAVILKNTKMIQYLGIALLIGGGVLGFVFKVPVQGGAVGAVGIALIVLQSTLSSPVWLWVIIGLPVGLGVAWIYHWRKKDSTLKAVIKGIEDYKKTAPQSKPILENILGRHTSPSNKKLIKSEKTNL